MRPIDYPYHMTYQEIAEELGLSRTRVIQIERQALIKLLKEKRLEQHWRDFQEHFPKATHCDYFQ